jgi:virginiamycin B lyase
VVGRITRSGAVSTFSKGLRKAVVAITTGPDGNLWAVESGGFKSTGGLARITPTGDVTEFNMTSSINGSDIITGPDGKLWFSAGELIGTAKPPPAGASAGTGLTGVRFYKIGKPIGFIHALTVGPKKTIWFGAQVEQTFAKVGKLTTGGRVTRLPQRLGSTRGSFLDGIATGADGNIWLTEAGRASVSSIDRVKLH